MYDVNLVMLGASWKPDWPCPSWAGQWAAGGAGSDTGVPFSINALLAVEENGISLGDLYNCSSPPLPPPCSLCLQGCVLWSADRPDVSCRRTMTGRGRAAAPLQPQKQRRQGRNEEQGRRRGFQSNINIIHFNKSIIRTHLPVVPYPLSRPSPAYLRNNIEIILKVAFTFDTNSFVYLYSIHRNEITDAVLTQNC